MRCSHVQSRLLSLPDPGRVPEALQEHLDACPGCRAWHQTLVRIEAALPNMPVVPSDGLAKAELLRRIEGAPDPLPAARPMPAVPDAAPGWSFASWLPAGAIAATLLIGTVAFLSIGGGRNDVVAQAPPDPLLERVVKHNVELANAATPADRVETLAQLAGELHQEMLDLAYVVKPDELKDLTELHTLFANVIDGVTEQAKDVNGPQRKEVLNRVAAQLALAGQEAENRARNVPPHTMRPLRELATAARKGSDSIQKLVNGRT